MEMTRNAMGYELQRKLGLARSEGLLQVALSNEWFEEAAVLRDRIKDLREARDKKFQNTSTAKRNPICAWWCPKGGHITSVDRYQKHWCMIDPHRCGRDSAHPHVHMFVDIDKAVIWLKAENERCKQTQDDAGAER